MEQSFIFFSNISEYINIADDAKELKGSICSFEFLTSSSNISLTDTGFFGTGFFTASPVPFSFLIFE